MCGAGSTSVRDVHFKANLVAPSRVLQIARLGHAFDDLAAGAVALNELASRHGFGSLRSLERQLGKCAQCSPRAVRRRFDRTEFAVRLAKSLWR